MSEADKVVPLPGQGGAVQWADSFVNLLAGLGVEGRDKFASQAYVLQRMSSVELETAYRGDWIARKAVTIPAWDMTREWRDWQADPDQITLLEAAEKSLFIQLKVQEALVKARLYGGSAIILGVDVGNPEDELDLEKVGKDSLKFIHVVSRNQITAGPIIYDISSKYFGQPEYYEARNTPVDKTFQQAEASKNKAYAKNQVRLHPSRVVKLIGVDTGDQMLSDIWGDSVLQAVNDAVKMCGLVSGSLATLVAELKVDVIKVPELKSILSTDAGTQKMLKRFSTANAAKSVINTILIDGNEEWQRITASLAGVPEVLVAYMQVASGAVDIPAGRFLGLPHRGLNVTGEADFRNYYDKLASEQKVTLTPAMTQLDEVLIRSTLGDHPPEVWYEWRSLWQLSESEKSAIALQKAQAYQIDVNAAQLPTTALANGRANQLIEDGFYPGLEQALDDAAAEGDTIEEHNKAPEMDPMMMANAAMAANGMDPTQPDPATGKPPAKPFGAKPNPFAKGGSPFPPKKANFPPMKADGFGDDDVEDINTEHEPAGSPKGGQFAPKDDLPAAPGTTPIPDGHVRLYHQTGEDRLEAIREGGLKMENAKGIEGPRAIYAGETGFYGKPGAVPTVEFSVPKERWREPFVRADSVLDKGMVAPENIIAIHYPWHSHARYIEDHPDTLKHVLSGQHDDLLGDPGHAPAITYIKRKYGGTKDGFGDYNERHKPKGEGGGQFEKAEGDEIDDPDRTLTPEEEKALSQELSRPEHVSDYELPGVRYGGGWHYDKNPDAAKFGSEQDYNDISGAMTDYKDSTKDELHSYGINKSLREGGELTPGQQKMVGNLDKAFDRLAGPIKDYHTKQAKDGWLYRGMDARFQHDLKVGDTFQDNGFISTSTNSAFAAGWARKKGIGGTMAKITAPAGTKVLPLSDRNPGSDLAESEVLLRRGTRFQVTKAGKMLEMRVMG